jgi:Xaa-Pro aminopeptidase
MVNEDTGSSLFQSGFPPAEFAARRRKVLSQIGEDAVAVLQGAGPVRAFEVFRQSNEFYYLCGVEVPQAYLLLDGREGTAHLYLPARDEGQVRSEGEMLSADDAELAQELTGVDGVHGLEKLREHIPDGGVIYVPHQPAEGRMSSRDALVGAKRRVAADPWDGEASREARFVGLLMDRMPRAEIRDLSPILDELRLIKSPREVDMMRRAGRLAALAATEAMRSTEPGVWEYQLGAVADYIFEVNGARGEGYGAIIAGGSNAWHGHYSRNDCVLRDGDLVLLDGAPDYGYYTSDIGRMWPVNGKYDPVQRELYGFVVEYHKALLARIRPGVLASQIMTEAAEEMAEVAQKTSFSKAIYEDAARRMLEFAGHLSHPVGMAVHDVGSYRWQELKPGMVFALDPQMWVEEEKLYMRCEDTVVVTEDGMENLTEAAPLELDDVEAVMEEEEGLVAKLPAGNVPDST